MLFIVLQLSIKYFLFIFIAIMCRPGQPSAIQGPCIYTHMLNLRDKYMQLHQDTGIIQS